jgi:hypothetical protein
MNRRLIKTALLALAAAAAILAPSSRADDTTASPTPDNQAAKLKFHGPISAVDTNAMTFTVGDQTFTITSKSRITMNGKTATLDDAVVGEPAHGSYIKGADGQLDITKVRFGKNAGGKHKKSESSETDTNAPAAPASNSATNSSPASLQQ